MARLRALGLAALAAVLVSPVSPAHAETLTADMFHFAWGESGSSFITVVCHATASGTPASSEVWCQVNSAPPEYFGNPGPRTAAVWFGSADMPVRVCVSARALYRNLTVLTYGPFCQFVTPPPS